MKKFIEWLASKLCKCDYLVFRAGKNKDIYTVVLLQDILFMELEITRDFFGVN